MLPWAWPSLLSPTPNKKEAGKNKVSISGVGRGRGVQNHVTKPPKQRGDVSQMMIFPKWVGYKEGSPSGTLKKWESVFWIMGFPGGATTDKEAACQYRRCKRHGFNPWVGKIPGAEPCNHLQYSCLEDPMGRGSWRATVHRIAQSQTQLKWLNMHTFWITVFGLEW